MELFWSHDLECGFGKLTQTNLNRSNMFCLNIFFKKNIALILFFFVKLRF